MMPEMDGFDFLQEFRRNSEWAGIPVIVVTAKSPTNSERAALEGLVSRVIQKGAGTSDEVLKSVHRHMHTRISANGGPEKTTTASTS